MAKSIQTKIATKFNLLPSGFTGSRGAIGFTGSLGIGFTGSAGTGSGSASTEVSNTAPVSTTDGDFWLNSDTSDLYVFFANSWVLVSGESSGYTGSAGTNGYTGSAGTDGYTGSAGTNGYTGSVGTDGYTGSSGIGYTGSAGTNGYTGSSGIGYTGSAGTLTNWSRKTANYTAINGDRIIADTSAGSFYITLPATPSVGHFVKITDGYNFAQNVVTIVANGSTIENQSDDVNINARSVDVEFFYDGTTWQIISTMGPKGFTGSAGSSGSIGFTGSTGTGYTGSAGSLGYTGSTGSAGFTGSTGTGFTGSVGSAGSLGYTGSQGTTGYTGSAGEGSTSTEVANAAPVSATEGSFWLNSDTTDLYVYYGNSWIGVSSGTNTAGYTGSAGSAGANGYTGSIGVGFTGSSGSQGTTGGVNYSVTNSGSSSYTIAGSNNPSLTLIKGFTYYFSVSASGHPFWIKTSQTTGTGNAYNTGVTNNGTDSGTITFTVPFDSPATLYYICQYHGTMTGVLNVVNSMHGYAGSIGFTGSAATSNITVSSDQLNYSTGYLSIPTGNTAQRPVSPSNGFIRYNTATGYGEIYNSAVGQWLLFGTSPVLDIEYLIVAGGGGGGVFGGGGGAGGYLTGTQSTVQTSSAITITVGAGGAGSTAPDTGQNGVNGSNSVFYGITAYGGGGGATRFGPPSYNGNAGNAGGSGGGGANSDNTAGGAGGAASPAGQGYAGGAGGSGTSGTPNYSHGGGGGAGGVGMTGKTNGSLGANGGVGLQNGISGTLTYYAGGGGGGVYSNSSGGTGGLGGGGNGGGGGAGGSGAATSGTANRGGGGGGGPVEGVGAGGGSGIVILKYVATYTPSFSAGLTANTVLSGGFKISTITAGTGTVTFTIA